MGPADSQVHDLTESDETPGICLECDLVCGPGAPECVLDAPDKVKEAQRHPADQPVFDPDDINDSFSEFEAYASQFNRRD